MPLRLQKELDVSQVDEVCLSVAVLEKKIFGEFSSADWGNPEKIKTEWKQFLSELREIGIRLSAAEMRALDLRRQVIAVLLHEKQIGKNG